MTKHTNISLPAEIIIGKDILELVSSAMYVEPLTVYREYIQNAADAIDVARAEGVLGENEPGRIEITFDLDHSTRSVKIRDNGVGVGNGDFAKRLVAIGGSHKRGTSARGFRGVGRLAGLGYCQELVFRSRSVGDPVIQELRWNCKVFKRLLSDHSYQGSLHELIQEVATVNEVAGDGWPEHFYEVELIKPIRIKSDLLLNPDAISLYLSQVAPVPFSPEFRFGEDIRKHLAAHMGDLGEVEIYLNGSDTPIYRPYRNDYAIGEEKQDIFTEPRCGVIDGLHGGISAVYWLLGHGYHGSISNREGVSGLRARKGNVQVGDHRIFSDIFPEARFASWTVGEVHVLDDRVVPNGRRDDFEQNAHYTHLLGRLIEVGEHIGRMCRSSSVVRNRLKAFDVGAQKIDEQLKILEQGAIDEKTAASLVEIIRGELHEVARVTEAPVLNDHDRAALAQRHNALESRLEEARNTAPGSNTLTDLPEEERAVVQKMIALIYECSANRVAAKSLVDRILARLGG